MSLEEIIAENTAAVKASSAALLKALEAVSKMGAPTLVGGTDTSPKATTRKAPAGAKAASEQPQAEASTASTPSASSSPSTQASDAATATAETAGVSYDDVKEMTLKLSGKLGRTAVVGLFSQFGVTKAPELKPEQYAAYMKNAKRLHDAPVEEALV